MKKFNKANNHLILSIAQFKGIEVKKFKNKSEDEIMYEVLKRIEEDLREAFYKELIEGGE